MGIRGYLYLEEGLRQNGKNQDLCVCSLLSSVPCSQTQFPVCRPGELQVTLRGSARCSPSCWKQHRRFAHVPFASSPSSLLCKGSGLSRPCQVPLTPKGEDFVQKSHCGEPLRALRSQPRSRDCSQGLHSQLFLVCNPLLLERGTTA